MIFKKELANKKRSVSRMAKELGLEVVLVNS